MPETPGFVERILLLPKEDGLAPIVMERLGRIVAIVGANGAGKTRILNRISTTLQNWGVAQQDGVTLARTAATDPTGNRSILDIAIEDKAAKDYVWSTLADPTLVPITMTISSEAPRFTPLKKASIEALQKYGTPTRNLQASADCLWRIGAACRDIIAARSEALEPGLDRQAAITRFNDLTRRILVVLGTQLTILGSDDFRLFGRPLDNVNLSQGQCRLLDIAVKSWEFQYAPAPSTTGEKRPLAILMDEPENHLHPDALIEMVDSILRLDEDIQIFVATHSLPLLAHIGTASTWFVREGALVFAGSKVSEIVESLLGGDRNLDNLRKYLSAPSHFAMRRFVSQCLLPPDTVGPKRRDPQTGQLDAVAAAGRDEKAQIRILDWGAGQGRLLAELMEIQESKGGERQSDRIDYYAYDPDDSDRAACEAIIERTYGLGSSRYFSKDDELTPLNGTIDVVVMCNVLHEIPPAKWPAVFKSISSVMKTDGRLLIAEDLNLSNGEQAFDCGFALLPPEAIRALCGSEVIVHDHQNERYRGRLVVYEVPASGVATVDAAAVTESLKALRDISLNTVKMLKTSNATDWKAGHRYAVASQSFVTASLLLEE